MIRPDGQPGIYGVVHFRNRAIGVVPLDAEGRVLLVGQFRYTMDHYSWEIPEGGGDLDEEPEAAARRELVEETGYSGGEWRELCRAELSNSVTDEVTVLFVASGLEAGTATPEGTEQLQLRWVPFDEVMAMMRRGEIADAMTILAIQQLADPADPGGGLRGGDVALRVALGGLAPVGHLIVIEPVVSGV